MAETTVASLLDNPFVLLIVVVSGLAVMTFSWYVLKQNAETMREVTNSIESMVNTLTHHKEKQDTEKMMAQENLLHALIKVVEVSERLITVYERLTVNTKARTANDKL